MTLVTRFLLASLATLCVSVSFVPLGAADREDKEIERLIKQFGSDVFREREQASRRLGEIGQPALQALKKATTSADLEVRRRAKAVVAVIENKFYGAELFLSGSAHSVSVSADGKRLLTIDGKKVRLWDADTGKLLRDFEGHTEVVRGAVISADGTRVLSGTGHTQAARRPEEGDNSVRLWDAQTGKEVCKYKGHTVPVTCVAFGPKGQALSGDAAGSLHLWDLNTGKTIRTFICRPHGHVGTVAYNAKARLAVTSGTYADICLWDLETGKEVRRIIQGDSAHVCFSPDGKRLAGAFNVELRIWDVATGKLLRRIDPRAVDGPTWVAFSPDGKRLVTANNDRTVRVCDAVSGKEICRYRGLRSPTFFPDGKRIAALTIDGRGNSTVRIWRAPR